MFNKFTTMLKNTVARLGNVCADVFYDIADGEALVISINRNAIHEITEEMLKEHAVIATTFSDGYHGEFLVKKAFLDKNGKGAGLRLAINRSIHAKGWPMSKNVVDTTVITTVEGVTRLTEGFPKVTEATGEIAEWAKPYTDLFGKGVELIGSMSKRSIGAGATDGVTPPKAAEVLPDVLDVKGQASRLTLTQSAQL